MGYKNPTMWIMKITPGGSGNTKKYFENLFVNQNAKKLIGYTKEEGDKIEEFSNIWKRIKIGDLIVVIEGFNRVYGVVEIASNHFDDVNNEGDSLSDWFYHRRKAELVKYFNPHLVAQSNTNRNTIIEYSGDGARDICDMVWEKIKDEYWKEIEIRKMQDKIDLLEYKKQIILQGPPGTGKTRLAKMMAEEMTKVNKLERPIDVISNHFKTYKPDESSIALRAKINGLVRNFQEKFKKEDLKNLPLENYALGTDDKDGFCYWQEYILTDTGKYNGQADKGKIYWKNDEQRYVKSGFLQDIVNDDEAMIKMAELLDNIVSEKHNVGIDYPIGKGFILKMLNSYYPEKYFPISNEKCLTNALKLVGENTAGLNYIQKNTRLQEIFEEKREKYKTDITNNEFMYFLFVNFNLKKEVKLENDELLVEGEYKIIQFHPAYSYEDFVRGISAKTNDKGDVNYKVENRILIEFANESLDNPKAKYVLIIDEINRANLPSVLGELIYALEYRYSHKKNNLKEAAVESLYDISEDDGESNRVLLLPDNLYIIGTMNTADRSVGHIDYAIKRRFAFVNVPPTADAIDDVVKDPILNANAKILYQKVADLFNEDKSKNVYLQSDFKAKDVQLGHSYFLVENEKQLKLKLEFEIKPLLNEYVKDGILGESALAEIDAL
jgi:5-methylcytosine-specific restriction protein B